MKYYISSCGFTAKFPDINRRILDYIIKRHPDMKCVRCCTPGWKVREYTDKMPEGIRRDTWALCHNCLNIMEEHYSGRGHSLWELVDGDREFAFPDYTGMRVTVQDCWRSRDRADEQAAVRSVPEKMNISYAEAPKNHLDTNFCGITLYRPQVARNPSWAPNHYAKDTDGLFLPHTAEEQEQLMREYCAALPTQDVVCYCHYCYDGLKLGGKTPHHLAQLLFPER